jgi:hypothetical protein
MGLGEWQQQGERQQKQQQQQGVLMLPAAWWRVGEPPTAAAAATVVALMAGSVVHVLRVVCLRTELGPLLQPPHLSHHHLEMPCGSRWGVD